MRFDFEWDIRKARSNVRNHKVTFERAATVFRDTNLLSIPDEDHSEAEERWITMGLDETGILLVLSHKFESVGRYVSRIRIISARKANEERKRTI